MNDQFTDPTQFQTDFNLDDEYKPAPLAPQGNYRGHTTQVQFDPVAQSIVWQVTLQENDGLMSDGETPIDGQQFYYRNWLPRIGDEDIPTKSGRMNKRQAKINMMKEFADKMQIQMADTKVILENLTEGNWVGIPVIIKVGIGEYEGRTRNEVNDMIRDPDGE